MRIFRTFVSEWSFSEDSGDLKNHIHLPYSKPTVLKSSWYFHLTYLSVFQNDAFQKSLYQNILCIDHKIMISNITFEMMEQFKYFGTTLTNQIPFMKKLSADWNQGMLVIILCRIFVFQFAIQKHKIKTYRTVILPVVSYGYETWSLTLREKRRISVFENRLLRRIFEPKRQEVTGEWRRVSNEKLYFLYSSPNIVQVIEPRRMRWAGDVVRMGGRRGAYRVLVGKPEGRTPLGVSRHR